MDIFTTREISWILLWFIIFVLLISWEKTRPSVINVINSFFKKAIIYVLGITTIYSYVVIMIFKILGNILNIWNNIYIKDIIIWVIFSSIIIIFDCITKKIKKKTFISGILENIKLVAIIEAVTNIYTYPLWAEILLSIILFITVILKSVSETMENNNSNIMLIKIFNIIILNIFIIYLIQGIYYIIKFISIEIIIEILISILIPFICFILYVPLFYFMTFYSLYESLFIFINAHLKHNNLKLKIKDKIKIFLVCNLSTKKIEKFRKIYVNQFPLNEITSVFSALSKVKNQ